MRVVVRGGFGRRRRHAQWNEHRNEHWHGSVRFELGLGIERDGVQFGLRLEQRPRQLRLGQRRRQLGLGQRRWQRCWQLRLGQRLGFGQRYGSLFLPRVLHGQRDA
jgi:hypothetical protein